MRPFVLSAIEEALYTPRQLFHPKVQFMSLAQAEKKTGFNLVFCSDTDDSGEWWSLRNHRRSRRIGPWPGRSVKTLSWKEAEAAPLLQRSHPPFVDGLDWVPLSVTLIASLHYEDLLFFSRQGYNNQAPYCSGTLITLSYQCLIPFKPSMNHCGRIHCVTETRAWEEFTHCV